MREELVDAWMKEHPVLKEFKQEKMPNSPPPRYLIKLIPDSLGAKFLFTKLKIVFDEKLPSQACRVELKTHQIKVSPRGYDHFIRALGLYAWHHVLNEDQRNIYASFVGAHDSEFLFKKSVLEPENSTAAHFARNFQNVITLQPLEFAQHQEGASRSLLAFFRVIGVIDDPHFSVYSDRLKTKRAYLADTPAKVREAIDKYPVTPEHVAELLKIIVPLELAKEKRKRG